MPLSLNRRTMLGAAAAAPLLFSTARAATVVPAASETAGRAAHGDRRRVAALRLRTDLARAQFEQRVGPAAVNDDEQRFARLWGNYSKGLPHDDKGEVDRAAYRALLRAIRSGDLSQFEAVPPGVGARQVSPLAALAFALEGADSHALRIGAAPSISSEEHAAELAELYWLALTRDVPFSQYEVDPLVNAAAADLRRFRRFRGVTPASVFRGETAGDGVGPYISQFLLLNVPFGANSVPQAYRTSQPGSDHMVDYQDWLAVQNGGPASTVRAVDPTPRYLRNGRDLADYVFFDFTFQAFLHAAQVLLSFGPTAFDPANPYRALRGQVGFVTLGASDILTGVAKAADCSLKAAWYQKWQLHRRARPEAYAGTVHNALTGRGGHQPHAKLLSSQVLAEVFSRFGGYLLPQAYPAGCPLHPSYPAGHAAIAGACVTLLKIVFDENFVIPAPKVASDDGLSLLDYQTTPLRVGDELNKLAANIALGRDTAGVHWRSDGIEGLRLGEATTLALMQDLKECYVEKTEPFSLTTFDGRQVTV